MPLFKSKRLFKSYMLPFFNYDAYFQINKARVHTTKDPEIEIEAPNSREAVKAVKKFVSALEEACPKCPRIVCMDPIPFKKEEKKRKLYVPSEMLSRIEVKKGAVEDLQEKLRTSKNNPGSNPHRSKTHCLLAIIAVFKSFVSRPHQSGMNNLGDTAGDIKKEVMKQVLYEYSVGQAIFDVKSMLGGKIQSELDNLPTKIKDEIRSLIKGFLLFLMVVTTFVITILALLGIIHPLR